MGSGIRFARSLVFLLTSCSALGGLTWHEPTRLARAPEEPVTWYVCVDLPAEDLPAVGEAVDRWDRSLRRLWRLRVVTAPDERVACRVRVRESTPAEDESRDPRAMGWASTIGGGEVVLRRDVHRRDTAGILMHELGHAFGAQHVPGTLMDPTWAPLRFECPDATTVAQVAAWERVTLADLAWCNPSER